MKIDQLTRLEATARAVGESGASMEWRVWTASRDSPRWAADASPSSDRKHWVTGTPEGWEPDQFSTVACAGVWACDGYTSKPIAEHIAAFDPKTCLELTTLVTRSAYENAGLSQALGTAIDYISALCNDERLPGWVRSLAQTARDNCTPAEDEPETIGRELAEEVKKLRAEVTSYRSYLGTGDFKVRPEVAAFAVLMERKLRKNDHKGGWKECTAGYLFKRLREEVRELEDAYDQHERFCRSGARSASDAPSVTTDVCFEAPDVANFAMMIVDICGELDDAQNREMFDLPTELGLK